jgi:nucleotidyltransferase substrate binding protein (TIGR01987 family)
MEKLTTARLALARFREILDETPSLIVRDATVQRFEFSFEAISAAMQSWLLDRHGREARSPKSAARELFAVGDCTEEQAISFQLLTDLRNKTVHTYNEALADDIYTRRHALYRDLADILDCLRKEA